MFSTARFNNRENERKWLGKVTDFASLQMRWYDCGRETRAQIPKDIAFVKRGIQRRQLWYLWLRREGCILVQSDIMNVKTDKIDSLYIGIHFVVTANKNIMAKCVTNLTSILNCVRSHLGLHCKLSPWCVMHSCWTEYSPRPVQVWALTSTGKRQLPWASKTWDEGALHVSKYSLICFEDFSFLHCEIFSNSEKVFSAWPVSLTSVKPKEWIL
jgi:hypothetical protein